MKNHENPQAVEAVARDICDICCRPKSQHIARDLQCPETAYFRPMPAAITTPPPAETCATCGNPNRNHYEHLAPFTEGYHEFSATPPPASNEHAELIANSGPKVWERPGPFAEWPAETLAGQCRMQARENLDPEYCQFMNAVADRLQTPPPEVGSELIGAVNHLLEVGEFCRTDETSSALQRLRQAADALQALSVASPRELSLAEVKEIAAKVVQEACETDPADADHPNTILISTDDLETIVRTTLDQG